jgi:hypothetical protein
MIFSLKKLKRANKAGEKGDNKKIVEVEDDKNSGYYIAKENIRPKKKPTRKISRYPFQEKDINR